MKEQDLRKEIIQALALFKDGSDLTDSSLHFFETLGYDTSRQNPLEGKSFEAFRDHYIHEGSSFNAEVAMVDKWSGVDFLFQITNSELGTPSTLRKKVDAKMNSYLFFAVDLVPGEYSRSQLIRITREINKLFLMPAFILFRYNSCITLSVIERRRNRNDSRKDVLEKVTVVRDIVVDNPHRAHVEILNKLSKESLQYSYSCNSVDDYHLAWIKVLDTKTLNSDFYTNLSRWYFWALQHVQFPVGQLPTSALHDPESIHQHNAKNLIRLLTRLLFTWFLRQKKLIPDSFFDEVALKNILVDFDPNGSDTVYYRAVLQNLFFATLNRPVGTRNFRNKNDVTSPENLLRYASSFNDPAGVVAMLENQVPFLNGGLFECLDSYDDAGVKRLEDGFDEGDTSLKLPDYLFWGEPVTVTLTSEIGDSGRNVRVQGLIHILNNYIFTVTENTPIEEEVALDPELLGRVFENLLASYNPETKTTARKQTGSFYTPREIVDYMVSESLKAYLKQVLVSITAMPEEEADAKLVALFEYSDAPHGFDLQHVTVLIAAIDRCKILDPACGSGAFPMGILHKMVHILHKLDPLNELWKERQLKNAEAIEDAVIKDNLIQDIQSSFENNEFDYGRKLYLIENCIYGVDIQPIAVQISKLRFFISLIVDQKSNMGKENFGIRPLPNLETKIVAANTLKGLDVPKPGDYVGDIFDLPEIKEMESRLQKIRHQLFSAKNPVTKKELRSQDEALRKEMSMILENSGWSNETARKVAKWNPYDQNISSDWFDPEWMFGVLPVSKTEGGFDVVIGNPPYIQLQKDHGKLADMYKNCKYQTFERTGDIYALFYESGISNLKIGGRLCFITSNKWMRAGYGKSLRKFFASHIPELLIDCGPGVFENATVDVNILMVQRAGTKKAPTPFLGVTLDKKAKETDLAQLVNSNAVLLNNLKEDSWFIGSNAEQKLKEKIERIGKPLKDWDVNVYRGVLTGLNEAFIIDTPTKERLCAEDPKSAEILKPILRGRDIKRYGYEWAGLWLIASGFDTDVPKLYPAVYKHLLQHQEKAKKRDDQGKNWWNLRACAYYPEFDKEKVVWSDIATEPIFSILGENILFNNTIYMICGQKLKYLCAFLNAKVVRWFFPLIATDIGEKGNRFFKIFVENIVIPQATKANQKTVSKIEQIVDEILSAKKQNPKTNTSSLEREIDQLVYKLYELTEEEIAIVEGN